MQDCIEPARFRLPVMLWNCRGKCCRCGRWSSGRPPTWHTKSQLRQDDRGTEQGRWPEGSSVWSVWGNWCHRPEVGTNWGSLCLRQKAMMKNPFSRYQFDVLKNCIILSITWTSIFPDQSPLASRELIVAWYSVPLRGCDSRSKVIIVIFFPFKILPIMQSILYSKLRIN